MNKNILDEFWVDWDNKQWCDKKEAMSKVAFCLMENIPSSDDLINLRIKLKNLRDTEDRCLITTNIESNEISFEELTRERVGAHSSNPTMERPSAEARACRRKLDDGEITISEYAEEMQTVPRGTAPIVLDAFWADWDSKSLEEQLHLVMAALGYPRKGVTSGMDILNLGAYILDVEEKLGCRLPEF